MNAMILKPVISEKSLTLAASGQYVFEVPKNANKISVAAEVTKAFKVTVINVNMVTIPGKLKRVRNIKGKRTDIKKAIVTLKKGDKISAFEVEEG